MKRRVLFVVLLGIVVGALFVLIEQMRSQDTHDAFATEYEIDNQAPPHYEEVEVEKELQSVVLSEKEPTAPSTSLPVSVASISATTQPATTASAFVRAPAPTPPTSLASDAQVSSHKFSIESCDRDRESFFLYPEPAVQAVNIERELRNSNPAAAALLRRIACVAHPTWLVGGDVFSVRARVHERVSAADTQKKIPIFVVYSAPHMSRAQWHARFQGGEYHDWIAEIARGIGQYFAWVILEPDALSMANQYPSHEYDARMQEFRKTLALFAEHAPNARLYIDAGHSHWISRERKVEMLRHAGIEYAHGFSLNVANYQTTESNIAYGEELSMLLGGKRFVIDTSRNGRGPTPDNAWCNAPGRGLGALPTRVTNSPHLDALLWIKPPGESDGTCGGGPAPGKFWLEYALELSRNAHVDE